MTVGTESMQASARPVIFALKFPATMLQSSPRASRALAGLETASSPSMSAASLVAVVRVQRMVVIPQSAPAMPTIAVWPPVGASVGVGLSVRRTLAIISKTSSAAHSIMVFQLGSKGTDAGVRDCVIDFTGHLRGAVRRVL